MTHALGDKIDHDDRHDDQKQNGADIAVIELADRGKQFLPDAACPHKTHDGSAAHVDFKAQQAIGSKICGHLRQHGKANDLQAGAARCANTFYRAHIDILDDFGEQLAQCSCRMKHQCQHTGHRPKTEGDNEQQREDDFWNRTQQFQPATNDEANRRIGSHVG